MLRGLSWVVLLIVFLLTCTTVLAGTPGSFRGILIDGGATQPGWMYVRSRNDVLRLVRLAGAQVHYSDAVPEAQRRSNPSESLKPGAEVRIMARDDGHSRWYAEEIEILSLAPDRQARR